MALEWIRNLRLGPKATSWTFGIFIAAFLLVSLGVLLSDVTRDDVVALHSGLDGSNYADANVGSFFEISVDRVHGPLCGNTIDPNHPMLITDTKDVSVVNKLGKTLPILTALTNVFVSSSSSDDNEISVTHVIQWKVNEKSVTSDTLWQYTRDIMNGNTPCGEIIDNRTEDRDVRICPVHRVWKDEKGKTIAVFFDPHSVNGCRENGNVCSSDCPNFDQGQIWTKLKLLFDLIEKEV